MSTFFRFEGWLLFIGSVLLGSGYVLLWVWTVWMRQGPLPGSHRLIVKGVLGSGTVLILIHAFMLRDIIMGIGVILALSIAMAAVRSRS